MDEALLTTQEVADLLRIDRNTLYRILRSGALPSVNLTPAAKKPTLRVRRDDLDTYLERCRKVNAQEPNAGEGKQKQAPPPRGKNGYRHLDLGD